MIPEQELSEIKTQVLTVQKGANALVVDSKESMEIATNSLKAVTEAEKYVTTRKEEITRPLMKSLASIRDLFKPLESNLADAKKIIKSKILAYTIEEDERINKEKLRIAARVEKGTMKAETAAGKLEAVGEAPKTGVRTLKKVRIVDETAIPREFMLPNMALITEALLKKGESIPGCELYEEKTIVAR